MTATTAPETGEDALWDLERLRRARGLGDWMFEQIAPLVGPRVVEVGAGIGTFSERLLREPGVESLLAVEPEPACAAVLEGRLGEDERLTVAREELPEAPSLQAGQTDLVVCQNVLEHLADQHAAARAMTDALTPGGRLFLLVPAHPRLYGPLDRRYGHFRRYTREEVAGVIETAGLELVDLYRFNLLGVPGWWAASRQADASISRASLVLYELLLKVWRPIERRVRPPAGLSLIAHARRPR